MPKRSRVKYRDLSPEQLASHFAAQRKRYNKRISFTVEDAICLAEHAEMCNSETENEQLIRILKRINHFAYGSK